MTLLPKKVSDAWLTSSITSNFYTVTSEEII